MKFLKKYLLLIVLVLFFAASRRFMLRAFWFDEALTLLNFAMLPLDKIYWSYVIPNNHIGFTMLLRIWYLVMPDGVAPDVWCRMLSFAAACGFIVFSWSKFKNIVFRTGLCCFAVSVPFLIYATSVRGYMLSLLFSMITLYCARNFCFRGTLRSGVQLFVSTLCCVSILPSNLFVVGAAAVCAVPLAGIKFWKHKRFYWIIIITLSAFALFWLPLLGQLVRASELGEGWHDRAASLVAGVVSFAACTLPVLLSALLTSLFPGRISRSRHLILLSFAAVLPLVFCAKVAPFPRVYFPFFGIYLWVISVYASRAFALVRKSKGFSVGKVKVVYAAFSVGMVFLINTLPITVNMLSTVNKGAEQDDFFAPWYCSESHVPHETAKILSQTEFQYCYLSFSSDPWSVMYYSALNGVELAKFHFDGPRGRVQTLPSGSAAVINRNEDINALMKRFGIKCTLISENAMHRIFRVW